MMKRAILGVALCLAVLAGVVAPASADDRHPPPWRGQPDTTWQEATFSQSWDVSWEVVTNPFGTPDIWMYGDVWTWQPEANGREGVVSWGDWRNGFSMDIPNNLDPNKEKRVWIQVTYYSEAPYGPPLYYEVAGMGQGGGHWGPGTPDLIESIDYGDGWFTDVSEIVIEPNPDSEFVGVLWCLPDKSDCWPGMVDQIIVETICIPEPATLALVVLGGLALARRRRT